MAYVDQQLSTLGRHCTQYGFRLSIETGYPASVRDFVRLIHEIEPSMSARRSMSATKKTTPN